MELEPEGSGGGLTSCGSSYMPHYDQCHVPAIWQVERSSLFFSLVAASVQPNGLRHGVWCNWQHE